MNDTIKIGLPMEYEDDKNIIRTGLWLKEYEVEALEKRLNKCNQLQSNWNSLKEFINEWIENLENQRESIEGTDLFENHTLVILDDIKIRMNELEGVDNEDN